ncbi:MAG: hypothetical protein NWR73_01335, partial [Flavobacteriales bacterium]|nr:hypothetical protein [Flavobacteriales bacterium]
MKFVLFSLTLILNIIFLRASGADDSSLASLELRLVQFSEGLRNAKSDTERLQFDDSLKMAVETVLSTPE